MSEADKDAEIYDAEHVAAIAEFNEKAALARVAKLEEVLKECADDLEAEFLHRYKLNDGTIHPAQQRDFDRDMDLVVRARAALKDTL
jgi:hypothetical protein